MDPRAMFDGCSWAAPMSIVISESDAAPPIVLLASEGEIIMYHPVQASQAIDTIQLERKRLYHEAEEARRASAELAQTERAIVETTDEPAKSVIERLREAIRRPGRESGPLTDLPAS